MREKVILLYFFYVFNVVKTDEISPETTLNEYLRKTSHLTGTKSMCLEGGCGACVVCVSFDDPVTHKSVLIAVNSVSTTHAKLPSFNQVL